MKKLLILFFVLLSQISHSQAIEWKEVATGVWKGIVGTPESYNLLNAAGAIPNKDALSKMSNAVFPLSKEDISEKYRMARLI